SAQAPWTRTTVFLGLSLAGPSANAAPARNDIQKRETMADTMTLDMASPFGRTHRRARPRVEKRVGRAGRPPRSSRCAMAMPGALGPNAYGLAERLTVEKMADRGMRPQPGDSHTAVSMTRAGFSYRTDAP